MEHADAVKKKSRRMLGRPAASTSWSSIGMKPPIIALSLVVVNSGDANSVGLCVEIQNWMLLIGFYCG
jgi:hypothetical protein